MAAGNNSNANATSAKQQAPGQAGASRKAPAGVRPATSSSAPRSSPSTSPPKNGGPSSPAAASSSASGASKRRKVGQACIYCRRSHMTCDESRPCKRCIKRDIGHLCHDETTSRPSAAAPTTSSPPSASPSSHVHGHTHGTSTAAAAAAAAARAPAISSPLAATQHIGGGHGVGTGAGRPSMLGDSSSSSISPVPPGSSNSLHPSVVGPASSDPTLVAPMQAPQPPSSQAPSATLPEMGLSMPTDIYSTNSVAGSSMSNWGAASMLGGAGFLGLGGGGHSGLGSSGDFMASGDAAGGNEFSILSEFLESLDGTSTVPTPAPTGGDSSNLNQANTLPQSGAGAANGNASASYGAPTPSSSAAMQSLASSTQMTRSSNHSRNRSQGASLNEAAMIAANSKTETFFLTAADQKDGSRDERLGRVIQAKLDAGLLRPYNHVKGYARLNQWMEKNCSQASRRRILKPLSVFRPAFRGIAQRLTNVDLIFIEEAFERLLLDYDRVFSTQGIPACLWRRTGEIYKGNKEFADLVGVSVEALREGKCAIYELMQEDSAVNYWEKYGAVCFDPGQKAVLTSCVLTTRRARRRQGSQVGSAGQGAPGVQPLEQGVKANGGSAAAAAATGSGVQGGSASSSAQSASDKAQAPGQSDTSDRGTTAKTGAPADLNAAAGLLPCCFSFTIRRDAWGIPYAIVGNFVPIPGQGPSAATTAVAAAGAAASAAASTSASARGAGSSPQAQTTSGTQTAVPSRRGSKV